MSSTFTITRDETINAALRALGVLSEGAVANATQLSDCSQALNILLKSWAQKGYKGWLYRTVTFPFVASLGTYTMGPSGATVTTDRPLRIATAWWQSTGTFTNRVPMVPVALADFNALTPSNQTGQPTTWNYQATFTAPATTALGTFRVWPAPLTTDGNFGVSVQRPIDDITTGANSVDVPQTLFAAMKFGLADAVGLDYGADERILNRVEKKAAIAIAEAFDFEEEDSSVFFQPNPQGGFAPGGNGGF